MLDSSKEEEDAEPVDTIQTAKRALSNSKQQCPVDIISSDKTLTVEREETLVAARQYCFDNNLSPKHIKEVKKQLRSSRKDENVDINRQESLNRGVMLYERNVRMSEESRRRSLQRAEILKTKEEENLTFQPEINPVSELIV